MDMNTDMIGFSLSSLSTLRCECKHTNADRADGSVCYTSSSLVGINIWDFITPQLIAYSMKQCNPYSQSSTEMDQGWILNPTSDSLCGRRVNCHLS